MSFLLIFRQKNSFQSQAKPPQITELFANFILVLFLRLARPCKPHCDRRNDWNRVVSSLSFSDVPIALSPMILVGIDRSQVRLYGRRTHWRRSCQSSFGICLVRRLLIYWRERFGLLTAYLEPKTAGYPLCGQLQVNLFPLTDIPISHANSLLPTIFIEGQREMVVYWPTDAAFSRNASRYIDPAIGFATAFNFVCCF